MNFRFTKSTVALLVLSVIGMVVVVGSLLFPGTRLYKLIVLGLFPMGLTVTVTILLCSYRADRKMPIGYGTLLIAATSIPATVGIVAIVRSVLHGSMFHSWSHPEDIGGNGSPLHILFLFAFGTAICLLPALCVVVYYQTRSKRDTQPPRDKQKGVTH